MGGRAGCPFIKGEKSHTFLPAMFISTQLSSVQFRLGFSCRVPGGTKMPQFVHAFFFGTSYNYVLNSHIGGDTIEKEYPYRTRSIRLQTSPNNVFGIAWVVQVGG